MDQKPQTGLEHDHSAARRECAAIALEGLALWRRLDAQPEEDDDELFARYMELRDKWSEAFRRSGFTRRERENRMLGFPDPTPVSTGRDFMWKATGEWWLDFSEWTVQAEPR